MVLRHTLMAQLHRFVSAFAYVFASFFLLCTNSTQSVGAWKAYEPPPPPSPSRNFTMMNREAVGRGLVTAKDAAIARSVCVSVSFFFFFLFLF
jgi:hypothetical protein